MLHCAISALHAVLVRVWKHVVLAFVRVVWRLSDKAMKMWYNPADVVLLCVLDTRGAARHGVGLFTGGPSRRGPIVGILSS